MTRFRVRVRARMKMRMGIRLAKRNRIRRREDLVLGDELLERLGLLSSALDDTERDVRHLGHVQAVGVMLNAFLELVEEGDASRDQEDEMRGEDSSEGGDG